MRMAAIAVTTVLLLALVTLGSPPRAAGADEKVKDATGQVESGAKKIGEGVKETAKGVGKTVVEGSKAVGQKLEESGKAAEPKAKTAWERTKEGATSFGQSVKNFFGRLFSN